MLEHTSMLVNYQSFNAILTGLTQRYSTSYLHGMICGYICSDAALAGEQYVQSLIVPKKDKSSRSILITLSAIFQLTAHQLLALNYELELLLPDDEHSLCERAKAFSQWCEGFIDSITRTGLISRSFENTELADVIGHIKAFAKLDYDKLSISEADEKALVDITEYTRVAVGHLALLSKPKPDKQH